MNSAFVRSATVGALLIVASTLHAADVRVGLGAYTTELRRTSDTPVPTNVYTTANFKGPIPTNKWYSSLLFREWSQPLFAQPTSYNALEEGFEISMPEKKVRYAEERAENDIAYPHASDLTVKPLGFAMKDARLDKSSDWALDIVMGSDKDALKATIAHGSPFSYYQITRGDVQIQSSGDAEIYHRSADGKVVALKVIGGKAYAIYAPKGARWDTPAKDKLILHLPDKARYFSVAALPDAEIKTVEEFGKYAYAFITDTRVTWAYDEAASHVTSTFTATTSVKEGKDNGTIFALYPHQWHNNPLLRATLPYEYQTVRGKLKTVSGKSFQTRYTYTGFLPYWPRITDPEQSRKLGAYIDTDMARGDGIIAPSTNGSGTYWNGKAFGRATQLMIIAERQGDMERRDRLLNLIKDRLEYWFRAEKDSFRYFYYDKTIGTLVGYPDEYGSAKEINDHHFHYGYWINAAAQVALRDPAWAAKDKWGGMIELIIADIATTDPNDKMFTRFRNFDPYEGHSWASGIVPFRDGNNQESSSEAINAWAAMILWGEATGNKKLRDTGIFLYTTEIQAINNYWFDLNKLVFAPEYQNVETSMVWGNKYEHRVWWTNDPREVHGINLLPFTSASLYLGADPDFVKRNLEAMDKEFARYHPDNPDVPADIWQDVLFEFHALFDPQGALQRWNDTGYQEDGETRAHTYYWMQSLANLGLPDLTVTADTPFYQVFRKGEQRLYAAYNAADKPKKVKFSDGKTLDVPPKSLSSIRANVEKK